MLSGKDSRCKLPRLDSNQDKENQNLFASGRNLEPASTCGDVVFSPAHPPTPPNGSDPELARVVDAWPDLAEHVRATVLTLIDVALPARPSPTVAPGKRRRRSSTS